MLILVPDNETDRRAGRFSLVNPGKELYFVVFLAGSRNFGLSRFTAVLFFFDENCIQFDTNPGSLDKTPHTPTL